MPDHEIIRLDYHPLETATAHEKLGVAVRKQVHKILRHKVAAVAKEEIAQAVRQARQADAALESRIRDANLNPSIKQALRCYRDSLAAWTEGAKLDTFCRELLAGVNIDQAPVSGSELAWMLQAEQAGCQTGMVRDQDGAIWLWHTEEDVDKMPGGRFDAIRIFSFQYQGRLVESFIYPDLLPGPSFGWKEDRYVQAVDTLYIKPNLDWDSIPVNTVTWVSLCLGGDLPLSDIIQALNPYQTGYGLSAVTRQPGQVSGEGIEFAADHSTLTRLPEESNRYLFRVNLVSDRDGALCQKHEAISPEIVAEMAARIERTAAALQHFQAAPDKRRFLQRMISSREGDEYAYVNKDVKANLLCRMSRDGMEKWLGVGPASQEEETRLFEPDTR